MPPPAPPAPPGRGSHLHARRRSRSHAHARGLLGTHDPLAAAPERVVDVVDRRGAAPRGGGGEARHAHPRRARHVRGRHPPRRTSRARAGRPIVLEARDPANAARVRGRRLGAPAHRRRARGARGRSRSRGQRGNGLNVDDGGTPRHALAPRDAARAHGARRRPGRQLRRDQALGRSRTCASRAAPSSAGGAAVRPSTWWAAAAARSRATRSATAAEASGGLGRAGEGRQRRDRRPAQPLRARGQPRRERRRQHGPRVLPPAARDLEGPASTRRATLTIEGNTFVGSQAPVAFVGVDGAVFRFNTVYLPGRWALRILQETREEGFVPCRDVEVRDNLIVFPTDRWTEGGVNVGPGTEPASFRFARNVWFALDAPARTRASVRLPTPEQDGTTARIPCCRRARRRPGRQPGSPASQVGAHALPRGGRSRRLGDPPRRAGGRRERRDDRPQGRLGALGVAGVADDPPEGPRGRARVSAPRPRARCRRRSGCARARPWRPRPRSAPAGRRGITKGKPMANGLPCGAGSIPPSPTWAGSPAPPRAGCCRPHRRRPPPC